MSSDSEYILMIGMKPEGKYDPLGYLQIIGTQLQKFLPELFPLGSENIRCFDFSPDQARASDFLAKIPLEIFQQVSIPIFVISEWTKKKRRQVQEEYFNKFDSILTQHVPTLPLLILVHQPQRFVDPIRKREALELCKKCFRREKGKVITVATSVGDYSLKRAVTKFLKRRGVRPPTVVQPAMEQPTIAQTVPHQSPTSIETHSLPPVAPPVTAVAAKREAVSLAPEHPLVGSAGEKAMNGQLPAPPAPPVVATSTELAPEPPAKPESPVAVTRTEEESELTEPPTREPFPFGGLTSFSAQIKREMQQLDLTQEKPELSPTIHTEPISDRPIPPSDSESSERLSRSEFLDALRELDWDEPETLSDVTEEVTEESSKEILDKEVPPSPYTEIVEEMKERIHEGHTELKEPILEARSDEVPPIEGTGPKDLEMLLQGEMVSGVGTESVDISPEALLTELDKLVEAEEINTSVEAIAEELSKLVEAEGIDTSDEALLAEFDKTANALLAESGKTAETGGRGTSVEVLLAEFDKTAEALLKGSSVTARGAEGGKNGDSLKTESNSMVNEIADIADLLVRSEQITKEMGVEDPEEFSKAVALVEFLENLKTNFDLDLVGLLDLERREEIVMTGATTMEHSNELQQAFCEALNYAETLNPIQIYGRVQTTPDRLMVIRKITPNVVAVFIGTDHAQETIRQELGGTTEQLRKMLLK